MNKGILLVNLGTPDSPSVKDVRRFLREFLMDPLVVDIPFLPRWLLVNGIIAPLRGPKSASEYQRLWTEKGSPLKVHGEALLASVKEKFRGRFDVVLGMRYQNPDIRSALEELKAAGCSEILIFPLFPQYAEATSLSVLNKVADELKKMNWQVKTSHINSFETDEYFINAVVSQSNSIEAENIDHWVFSYHGLPERQLTKVNPSCLTDNCCHSLSEKNKNCYRAQCFATTRAIAKKLKLSETQYSICFQSRQGKIPWTQPYVDDVITDLAKQGHKNIMVFSPAFVADCLETTIEIGHTYRQLFKDLGGNDLHLVPGLNNSDVWLTAVTHLIEKNISE